MEDGAEVAVVQAVRLRRARVVLMTHVRVVMARQAAAVHDTHQDAGRVEGSHALWLRSCGRGRGRVVVVRCRLCIGWVVQVKHAAGAGHVCNTNTHSCRDSSFFYWIYTCRLELSITVSLSEFLDDVDTDKQNTSREQ